MGQSSKNSQFNTLYYTVTVVGPNKTVFISLIKYHVLT